MYRQALPPIMRPGAGTFALGTNPHPCTAMKDSKYMYQDNTESEIQTKARWVREYLTSADRPLPFSFLFNGQSSHGLLASWSMTRATVPLDDRRTQHTRTWSDPQTGLKVTCVAIEYTDFPAIEWTVFLKNEGHEATPVLEAIQGLDIQVTRGGEGDPMLHHNRGDTCGPDAYEPGQQVIAPATNYRFAPVGGRPTSLAFPYFNLQDGDHGTIIALGWPGQWLAQFTADDLQNLRITGGQEHTHLRLFPGEEIRAPLAVLLFWQGDVFHAQNLWRQFMFAYNRPRRNMQVPPAIAAVCQGLHQHAAGEQQAISLLAQNRVGIDYWWMDAGWFHGKPGPLGEWSYVGTWEPDPERFPRGINEVARYAHDHGMNLILWFEVERVSPGSAWSAHTDWLLTLRPEEYRFRLRQDIGTPGFTQEEAERNQIREGDRLFDLGNPEACQFLIDYVSSCVTEWGIDLFRLDFNISPLLFWRAADASDRQGMTENRYVRGLLRLFDTLLQRHPDLLIDSCASGGRRLDLETMRRTVVNTRSDYWCMSITGDQCQTHGIASWLPQYLCATSHDNTYRFHSNLAPSMGFGFDTTLSQPDQFDWDLFRQRVDQWRQLAPYFSGDYYPLTAWSSQEDVWLAWQFYRPVQGDGLLQFFRRGANAEPVRTFRPHGLDRTADYELVDLETGTATTLSGAALTGEGLAVTIPSTPGSVVLTLKRVGR